MFIKDNLMTLKLKMRLKNHNASVIDIDDIQEQISSEEKEEKTMNMFASLKDDFKNKLYK